MGVSREASGMTARERPAAVLLRIRWTGFEA
jgi:hypothetical protein